MTDAIHRRLDDELGLSVGELSCVLPDFAYTATDASGIVENEICPVFATRLTHPMPLVSANPDEVMDWKWVLWDNLAKTVGLTPFVYSPWAVQQVSLLAERGPWEAELPLARLRNLGFPKLVVSGAHHPAFDAVCDVLERELGAERAVFPGAGHSVQRAPGFNERLMDFLARA